MYVHVHRVFSGFARFKFSKKDFKECFAPHHRLSSQTVAFDIGKLVENEFTDSSLGKPTWLKLGDFLELGNSGDRSYLAEDSRREYYLQSESSPLQVPEHSARSRMGFREKLKAGLKPIVCSSHWPANSFPTG